MPARWRNAVQSLLLLGTMIGLWALLGWLLAGPQLMLLMLVIGLLSLLAGQRLSSSLVLALYDARPVSPAQAPGLHALLAELSRRAGLSRVPRLYHVSSRVMNAFSVGAGDRAALVVSDGLLRGLNWRQLAGVLAHEVGHASHGDIWVMALADMISRMTHLLSLLGLVLLVMNLPLLLITGQMVPWAVVLLLLFAPGLVALLQLALSRQREYEADRAAAELTGDPEGLATALLRLDAWQQGWVSQLFTPGRRVPDPSLLRTHPPTAERVRRLRDLRTAVNRSALHGSSSSAAQPLVGWPEAKRQPRWRLFGHWY
jgi:heat shock protein HtpX